MLILGQTSIKYLVDKELECGFGMILNRCIVLLKNKQKNHFTRKVDPLMIDPYSGFKINCYSAVCMSVWGLSLFSVFSGTPHP